MAREASDTFDRRSVLKMSGVAAMAALAGCSSSSSTPTPDEGGAGTPTPEEGVEFAVQTVSTGNPYADTKTAAGHVEGSAGVLAGGIAAGAGLGGDPTSEAAELRTVLSGLLQEHS